MQPHFNQPDDRLFVRGDDGEDLYPSCQIAVHIDGQPPVILGGKRIHLVLHASARRYVLELDADNRTSLAGYLLRDAEDSYQHLHVSEHGPLPQERQEMLFTSSAVY